MKYIILLFGFCGFLFASNTDISQTDFIERVINFVIFVAILWYFLADRLKQLLQNRKDGIINKLNEIQEKIKLANQAKIQANNHLEEAKKKAVEIVSDAKKEALLIKQKYDEQYKIDTENLFKHTESLMRFEQKKAENEAVENVLNRLFQSDVAQHLSNNEYIKIINKKVS
ncbi:F0F1 ATP synthase subunit B [Helicobacter fennelliae]|uniref:ATP synthase subunit b n=2 Tax=Helicobacter fennelliae TaxID=215 RepID=T1DV69_9HELI|nr:F0F1 ATP synthase subunit B [Helicobacter fennelliae]GAD18473.1 ATP synthase B chain [Helicobacter fennelliae MRY12-0050]SQB98817.1 ATP synthase F0F1 subunit B [Helicobacter fennelliae]STP08160.1 ATP synthase F0F1 subunit B [Helicobacter fennelliae]